MALTPREAQLWVRGRAAVVARSLLEMRNTPPREWTVARTGGTSDPYLVCPSCRHRARLPDSHVTTLRCPRCNELFTIAWDDGSDEPSREELRADHRMTRRRTPRARRSDHERRNGDRRTDYTAVPAERRLAERRVIVYRRGGWERRRVLDRRHRATNW